ncbi:MAG: hypothetical protein AAGF12_16375 [Myxococcota bacterium]
MKWTTGPPIAAPRICAQDRTWVVSFATSEDAEMTRGAMRMARLTLDGEVSATSNLGAFDTRFEGLSSSCDPREREFATLVARTRSNHAASEWALELFTADGETLAPLSREWLHSGGERGMADPRLARLPDGELHASWLSMGAASGPELLAVVRGRRVSLDRPGRRWLFRRSEAKVSNGGSVGLAWVRSLRDEDGDLVATQVVASRIGTSGALDTRVLESGTPASGYSRAPVVAWRGEELVVAWGRPSHPRGQVRLARWAAGRDPTTPRSLDEVGAPLAMIASPRGNLLLVVSAAGGASLWNVDRSLRAHQTYRSSVRGLGDQMHGAWGSDRWGLTWRESNGALFWAVGAHGRPLAEPRVIAFADGH